MTNNLKPTKYLWWKGKPLEDYSKVELCEIIVKLNKVLLNSNRQHIEDIKEL